ncbi:glycine betaine ABC transporter substrate-binding protein [Amphibacillus jilinensis]|uniref:glycine betaine ABC transporter substrate-binding protein n=1 Tax=Amphibacillus jilinensis TaxID=1216008 RepID=UPI0002E31A48|nr:glycine betaine ABC transporter substrate-binding protein [Amphibacillus jilinensis]
MLEKVTKLNVLLILSVFAIFLASCGTTDDVKDDNVGALIDYTITGIEPGAGTTTLAREALEEYENLTEYTLEESSTAAMLAALNEAIAQDEPIVVTGWTPHWKFAMYDLKFLDDPKETFGGVESIHTMTRQGLEEDMPEAFTILDRFYWEVDDMEQVMLMTHEDGLSFEKAAKVWIEENEEIVSEWTDDVEQVNGESFELVLTPWDTELASAAVLSEILSRQGYQVTETPVDPSVMFQALASGDGDASAAPWLPATHAAFYEQYQDEIVDLGANLEGAKIGFVVPSYVDIESIEDLESTD